MYPTKKSNRKSKKKSQTKKSSSLTSLTSYQKFVKKEMKGFSPSVNPTKRMKEIAKRWRKHKG
jgi:hypothetical protein